MALGGALSDLVIYMMVWLICFLFVLRSVAEIDTFVSAVPGWLTPRFPDPVLPGQRQEISLLQGQSRGRRRSRMR